MKIKRVLIGICILLIFVISGCDFGGGGRDSGDIEEDFRTGSQGLEMNFLTNYPPSKVYDDEGLDFVVEVRNMGATDIDGGNNKIFLWGFDNDIITGISTSGKTIDDLEGKDLYNPGDYDTIEYSSTIRDLESRGIDEYPTTIKATACYTYETLASPTVCIDGDPFGLTSTERVCSASSVNTGTQGAPISVSSVDVEAMPGRTKFKIYVKNVGSGTVFKDDYTYVTRCNPYDSTGLSYNDINHVALESVDIGADSIKTSCKPLVDDKYIRLSNGEGYVFCELDGITDPAYQTPLRIKLTYGYQDSITTSVQIIKTP